MSFYNSFMSTTQAINTINARRTALAVSGMLEQQLASSEQAEARRLRLEGLKSVVFEGAKIVREAGTLLPTSAPAAFYLALRAAPIFGANGVRDADLPDFQDKAFHHDVAIRRSEIEQSARQSVDMATAARIERITQLDAIIPQVRALAAWLQIIPLEKGPLNSLSTNEGGIRGLVNIIGFLFFGSLIVFWLVGLFAPIIAGLLGLLIWAYIPVVVAQHVRSPGLRQKATQILGTAGLSLPPSLGVWRIKENAAEIRESLAGVPEIAGLGASDLEPSQVQAVAAQLDTERSHLWQQVFGPFESQAQPSTHAISRRLL
ncbi:MAG: hypothetical protein M3Z05_21965 [Gemmatimonadota bacterium]|nr:hypothetical protein [Gemmatimonadota bacterium]